MRSTIQEWVIEARERTFDLVRDLSDEQLRVPMLGIVNPLLWEIGHVAYFQEYWVLREAAGRAALRADADSLYDSAKVAHDTRWNLPLPSRETTIEYIKTVRDLVVDRIAASELSERDVYFILLSVFHEDMHDEAFTITRQTLGYAPPQLSVKPDRHSATCSAGPLPGDVTVPTGSYVIGSASGDGFIFDNEKWGRPVELQAFQIARAPVTQSQFLAFVEDDGYSRRELWTEEGWAWRSRERAAHPIYWRRDSDGLWTRRHFNRRLPLEPHRPVSNICRFEAEAWCKWANRRLPTEFEWEAAARGSDRRSANLDWGANDCCDVAAHSSTDSVYGCRQMLGNIWEWTSSDFLPYPGFSADAYKEYSEPWFRTHKTLRGGAFSTRSRLIRAAYRNFYMPDRRDIFAGFRACALNS